MLVDRKKVLKEEMFEENQFLEDALIYSNDLQGRISTQSGHHYKYGKLAAMASYFVREQKLHIETIGKEAEVIKAQAAERVREEIAADPNRRVTESAVSNGALSDLQYVRIRKMLEEEKRKLVGLEFDSEILSLCESIFRKRVDLLCTLGYMLMGERRSGNVSVRDDDIRGSIDQLHSQAKDVVRRRHSGKDKP